MMDWYKRYRGTAFDPKFKAVALSAGSTRCNALAVWDATLEFASEHDDRGSVVGLNSLVVASGLDLAVDEVNRILAGFVALGMIAADRIAKWAKRQGVAVAAATAAPILSAAARRTRRYRQRKAEGAREPELPFSQSVTEGVTGVTEGVTRPVTATTDLDSDKKVTPPGPPQRGVPPGSALTRGGSTNARQVEILMPIQGGRDGKRRRETADERRMRECYEALARAGMADRLARHGAAASAGADDRDIFSAARCAAGSS